MEKVKLSRQVKATTSKLLDWIAENDVAVHDKIPSMSKLSKKFEVSVNTLHSAVRHLAKHGVLASGVGSGTFLMRSVDKFDLDYEGRVWTVGLVVEAGLANRLEFQPEILNSENWGYRILRGIYKAGKTRKIRIKTVGIPRDVWNNPSVKSLTNAVKPQLNGIDGLISFPMKRHVLIDAMESLGLPWVLVNPPDDMSTTNYVSPDHYGASVVVGQLAARLGAKHIWMLTTWPNWPSNRQRIRGLRDGLMFEGGRFGEMNIIVAKEAGYYDGFKSMFNAFRKYPEVPDFIYTGGDDLAKSAVEVVRAHSLEPGRDVSIISSTGLPNLVDCDPPISTVELPMEKTGETTVEMVRRMLETNQHTLPAKIISTPIVLRNTTPPEAKNILEDIEKEEHTQQYDVDTLVMLP